MKYTKLCVFILLLALTAALDSVSLFIAAGLSAYLFEYLQSSQWIVLRSYALWLTSHRLGYSSLRTDFMKRTLAPARKSDTNPHAESAASRSSADNFVHEFSTAHGLHVHSVSSSPKDAWNGVQGSRYYYFEKDLRMEFRNDAVPDNALIKMVDVDFYLEKDTLHDYIMASRAMMMYTIIPEHLSQTSESGIFTVSSTGEMTETHAGSTPYTHVLWDWRRDYITCTKLTWYGYGSKFVHCYVDYRKVSENRFLVLITPVTQGGFLAALIWYITGQTRPLARWTPIHVNGVNILPRHDGVIVALPNARTEHFLTNTQYSELLYAKKVTSPDVQRIARVETGYELAHIMSLLQTQQITLPPMVFNSRDPRDYKVEYTDVFDGQKSRVKCQNAFPPIIDAAFVPTSSKSNDLDCLEHRLFSLQKEIRPVPHKYYPMIDEFSEQVIPTPGSLHPISFADVYEESSTAQVLKYENAMREPPGNKNKAFQKSESYPEIKPARNISAVDPKHVVRLSRFTRPYTAFLKANTQWYTFGRTPPEMAEDVRQIMADTHLGSLVEGDFSRYDGRQSTFLVDLNLAIMLRLFHPMYHDEIRELRYELSYAMFTTEYGIKYSTSDSQKSGSASTSCDNTVDHAFCQYAHFRNLQFTTMHAYKRIGMCAGDDGLLRTPNPEDYENTCKDLNLVLKSKVLAPGDRVSFLGRIWSNWDSDASFFDPLRALSKLHFSDNSDRKISRDLLAWRKCAGYFVTDSGNFVGHIARKILEITVKGKTDVIERRDWMKGMLPENTEISSANLFAWFTDHPIFPCPSSHEISLRYEDGSFDESFLMFCDQIRRTPEDVHQWYLRFLKIKTLEEIETIETINPSNSVHVAVSIDGKLVGPPMGPAPIVPPVAMPVCFFFFTRKKCTRKDCKFRHDIEIVCHDFCKGKCARKQCKREHVALSAKF